MLAGIIKNIYSLIDTKGKINYYELKYYQIYCYKKDYFIREFGG